MKTSRLSPCASCPYRKDARLAFWHADHFTKLLRNDKDALMGAMYHCHEDGKKPVDERGFCVGWLLDQRRRGFLSIQLRIALGKRSDFGAYVKTITDGGVKMFASVQAMCRANLTAIRKGHRETIGKEKTKKDAEKADGT